MQRNLAILSLSSAIKYVSQRLLSNRWTGFVGHDTERTKTDDLLERMSLRELGDLPLGPEPRFVDSGGSPLLDADGSREERKADLSGSHVREVSSQCLIAAQVQHPVGRHDLSSQSRTSRSSREPCN
jgi:hypothetical protein